MMQLRVNGAKGYSADEQHNESTVCDYLVLLFVGGFCRFLHTHSGMNRLISKIRTRRGPTSRIFVDHCFSKFAGQFLKNGLTIVHVRVLLS